MSGEGESRRRRTSNNKNNVQKDEKNVYETVGVQDREQDLNKVRREIYNKPVYMTRDFIISQGLQGHCL